MKKQSLVKLISKYPMTTLFGIMEVVTCTAYIGLTTYAFLERDWDRFSSGLFYLGIPVILNTSMLLGEFRYERILYGNVLKRIEKEGFTRGLFELCDEDAETDKLVKIIAKEKNLMDKYISEKQKYEGE